MKRVLSILVSFSFLILGGLHSARAEKNPGRPKKLAGELELLWAKLEQQSAEIVRLEQKLQRQGELIEQQQRLLEALQPSVEHASAASAHAAAQNLSPAAPSAKVAESPAAAQSTPKVVQNNGIESGFGKVTFNGLAQVWYAAGDGGFRNTFRARRLELKFSGQLTPKVKWTGMIDPTKGLSLNNTFAAIGGTPVLQDTSVNQAGRILQDMFITLDYIKGAHIDIGQHKVPLSLEGLQSSAALETVERTMFASDRARGGTLGDVRDLGASIRAPITSHADFHFGVFNGSSESQNDVDKNTGKSLASRFVVRPVKGLQIGGSGVWAHGQSPDRPRRDRAGAELLFTRGPFKFKSEVMTGKDAALSRVGYYTLVAYKVRPEFEPVFRFDVWDPDRHHETNSADVTERQYVAGLNYYITENNVKLQFNYVRRTFGEGILPSRNLFLMNLQTSW